MVTIDLLLEQQKDLENDDRYNPAVKQFGKAMIEAMIITALSSDGLFNPQFLAGFTSWKELAKETK